MPRKHKFTGSRLREDEPNKSHLYENGTRYMPGDPLVPGDYRLNIIENTIERAFYYYPEFCWHLVGALFSGGIYLIFKAITEPKNQKDEGTMDTENKYIKCYSYTNENGQEIIVWPPHLVAHNPAPFDPSYLKPEWAHYYAENGIPMHGTALNVNASPLEGFMIFNDYTVFKFTSQLFFNIFLNFFIIFLFILPILILFQNKILNISIHILNIFKFFFDLFKNIIIAIRLERFFFLLLSIFTVIIFFNFGGFSLHELSFTSHAFVTLFLSFIIFFNIFFNIIINFNSFFYKKFIQENLNLLLTILLFVIEIISFFIRPLSLGIRLFTNILAGHILIHIFFGFFLFLYNVIFWFSFLVFIFCNLILGLEIFVAVIQSYIFFVLSVVYLKDAFILHG